MHDNSAPIIDPEFAQLSDLAVQHLEKAGGGAFCVYRGSDPVVDIWAGYRDPFSADPWTADTMAMSWSTTKGLASAALHMLAERGLVGYDDLVSTHWPEFAANGKGSTTVRHVLSMQAGLYDIRGLIADPRQMLDHQSMAKSLAAAAPAHEPGSANGYHAFTYGWLIGELVQRIAGVTLGSFIATEIAQPLGLDGCYIGTPRSELARVATRPTLAPLKPAVRLAGKALNPVGRLIGVRLSAIAGAFIPRDGDQVIGTEEFLTAEVPSINGTFTARSLARLYAALGSDDGIDGVKIWTPETRRAAAEQQTNRRDRILPLKMGWKLGYHRPFPRKMLAPTAFGFFGAYGSGGFADPERQLAVGLVVQEAKGLPLPKLVKSLAQTVNRPDARTIGT
ncbi:MAG: beta-lactamase family protein [Acidimicrobiia bacterium]|nr:beta-lactamase family protein [Acidimicrobiia bacterium]